MIYDILIIGGGASGLFLAANLKGKNVAILEKNSSAGKKILASGGGRCNITNRHINPKNYLADENFIKQALDDLSFKDILDFFSQVKFKEQKNSQFFSDSSSKAVLNALLSKIRAEIFYNADVIKADKIGDIFEISTKDDKKFMAKNLVIATGGASYKALGASDIGLKIASDFGLKINKFEPALVGFTVQKDEFWFKNLSGVCFEAEILLGERKFSGDILFTHKGISGPAILNTSLFWKKGQMSINFLPNFNKSGLVCGKKQLSSVLNLPKSFVVEFLKSQGLKDMAFNNYDNTQKELVYRLFKYDFAPAGTFGFERAEVSRGGVCTTELNENFQSKNVKNLYFIGEVLDVTGMLGGYNLHFAFASAKQILKALA
ncbi:oxidoreductase [Campylobacter mucosalis]|uniref:Flavoprotein, HI0933 family n=1 Tax=Campylobacter mucosalis CCUG 21559 TaxID=1032067 RepID=A0A6G5QEY0_9BACT|nr:aminoacetone oxidase family FAD-binding enzyme [Campylobacter mucosalis]KEA46007.1 oxidoreductase [Campylobacter mucosalis]QCD44228.1 flavoprotein, HI0933 family [Campylobacter mucosalis CCUG 21559]QKF63575.1 flavoprotein, HI0933 family [Campylobacter mucosalis]